MKGRTQFNEPVFHVFQSDAVWDGREFLVVYSTLTTERTTAFRVSHDGRTVTEPFQLLAQRVELPKFASNGTKQLMLWLDRRLNGIGFTDVVSRAADDFAALSMQPDEMTLVSYSGVPQLDVQVASSPAGLLGVWHESTGAIRGVLNEVSISIAPEGFGKNGAAAIAGSRNFLVAWYEAKDGRWDVYAKRVSFDGGVLDAEPLVLATDIGFNLADNPGLAWDGSRFLLAFVARGLHLVRVSDEGTIVDRRVIDFADYGSPRWPDPVWTGTELLVPYAAQRMPFGCDICPPEWTVAVERAGLGVNGGDTPAPPLFAQKGYGHAMKVVAAAGAERVMIAWMLEERGVGTIHFAQLSHDGKLVAGPFRLRDVPGASAETLALAWNGAGHVLGWSERSGVIRAMRFTDFGQPIDFEPFVVAGTFSKLSITPTTAGVAFGYHRTDEESGHVARAFTRTLERTVTAPRRRSVRR